MAINNSTDRAYDWNDTIENDSTYTLLPAGVYPFTVTSFERGRHNGSAKLPACPKAILTIDVDGGSLGHSTIKHNLFLHSKCEGLLCAFFTGIGQRKHGEQLRMPWDRVVGAKGMCEVGIHEWTSERTGETMQANDIQRFLAPDAAKSEAPAAPGWNPGQF